MKNLARQIFGIYVILLLSFTLLLIAVFSIPTKSIRNNVVSSVDQMENEGLWFKPFDFYLYQIDNMTDCLMFNIAVTADDADAVKSSMLSKVGRLETDSLRGYYLQMPEMTRAVALSGSAGVDYKENYSRYWHGYQVLVRPLLVFMDYNGIRILNYLCLSILLAVILFLLYKRLPHYCCYTFLACLLLFNAPIVGLAIQFSTCFYIAFIGMIVILLKPSLSNDVKKSALLFFSLGCITSFADFLTTPQLTFGLPLTVLLLQSKATKKSLMVVKLSMVWLIGYAAMWASKWFMAWLLTGENVMESVIWSARLRVSDSIVYGGEVMNMSDLITIMGNRYLGLTENVSYILFVCSALTIIALLSFFVFKNFKIFRDNEWLLLLIFSVPVWYVVMKNHTLQHIFFTWRAMIVSVWCAMLLYFRLKDGKKCAIAVNGY